MPDITALDTKDLLDQIQAGPLTQPESEALTELYARIIKDGDSDATAKVIGGIRPKHHPIV